MVCRNYGGGIFKYTSWYLMNESGVEWRVLIVAVVSPLKVCGLPGASGQHVTSHVETEQSSGPVLASVRLIALV